MRAYLELELDKEPNYYLSLFDKIKEYKRSKLSMRGENNKLIIDIEAKDLVALAATMSSITKQLLIISKAQKLV